MLLRVRAYDWLKMYLKLGKKEVFICILFIVPAVVPIINIPKIKKMKCEKKAFLMWFLIGKIASGIYALFNLEYL